LSACLFMVGFCCGALYPLGLALLGDRVPSAGMARANACYLACNCAGSLCGPVLFGITIDLFGQPSQFLVGGGAVAAVLGLWGLWGARHRKSSASRLSPGSISPVQARKIAG